MLSGASRAAGCGLRARDALGPIQTGRPIARKPLCRALQRAHRAGAAGCQSDENLVVAGSPDARCDQRDSDALRISAGEAEQIVGRQSHADNYRRFLSER